MKLTNKHNLPEAIVKAIGTPYKPVPGVFRATDFTSAPLVRRLKEEHWDALEQDVSDMLWMLLGTSVHYVLEKGAPKEALSEEGLEVAWDGVVIRGTPDLWHNGEIHDYKTTSVYAFILGEKPEWTLQLNIYRWLYKKALNMDAHRLIINAILRDWQASKAKYDPEYPAIPFQQVAVPVWDGLEIELALRDWIYGYLSADAIPCTDEQRWTRPATYAVMKEGRKTALRVLYDYDEALQWVKEYVPAKDTDKVSIDERKGEYARCKSYCQVARVCPYNPYREV